MKSNSKEFTPQLRCKIDEKAFSKALFVCRFFTGLALMYMALGSLLYWREFLVNTVSFGIPLAVWISFGLCAAELVIGLFLLLGWRTRACACVALPLAVVCAIIFFAGDYNAVFAAWCLLLCAPLGVLIFLGSGVFSLDFKRSQRQARQFMRGKL